MTLPVAAIVVNFNTRADLEVCLESLFSCKAAGELEEIIVVDCDSSDGSSAMVRAGFPSAHLLEVANLGYGAGANAGMESSTSPYLFVLNSDTVVPAGAIATLFQQAEKYPSVAIAGPRLRFPEGRIQSSRRRFPKPFTPVFESSIVQEYLPQNAWTRHYYMQDQPEHELQEVDWVTGAALFVRRSAFESAGGFDPDFRMFSEETDWCYRLKKHGWKIVYIPQAEVIHVQGTSTSQNVLARQLMFDSSRIELHRRLFGRQNARFVQLVVWMNYLAYLSREAIKWSLGHKRELRAARVRLYFTALTASIRQAFDARQ